MIHHLIVAGEDISLHVERGLLVSGKRRIAIDVLGSVQCFAVRCNWSSAALQQVGSQCPLVMARWNTPTGKWLTTGLLPRCRYVNPDLTYQLARLHHRAATQLASDLIFSKIRNQHALLRGLDPKLEALPRLAANSFQRILHLESRWARFFWARFSKAASEDLFIRQTRNATTPLNVALNYGYGFLYHALEWQCTASGIEPGYGLIHTRRRNRPSLVCDLIEPLRSCVDITVIRHRDEMGDKTAMAARFAAMMEQKWRYRDKDFRLRTIIRLTVESFARSVAKPGTRFHPFVLHARDACL